MLMDSQTGGKKAFGIISHKPMKRKRKNHQEIHGHDTNGEETLIMFYQKKKGNLTEITGKR